MSAQSIGAETMGNDLFGVAGLTPGGVGALGTFVAAIVALIKIWPVMARQAMDARAAKRAEGREEAASYLVKLDRMDARLTAAENRTHEIELKFTVALGAYRIVASELQRISPESSALMQAQALLTAAYPVPADMPAAIKELITANGNV